MWSRKISQLLIAYFLNSILSKIVKLDNACLSYSFRQSVNINNAFSDDNKSQPTRGIACTIKPFLLFFKQNLCLTSRCLTLRCVHVLCTYPLRREKHCFNEHTWEFVVIARWTADRRGSTSNLHVQTDCAAASVSIIARSVRYSAARAGHRASTPPFSCLVCI